VTDDYKAQRFNFVSFYSQLGFNVVAIDSRGSHRRGIQFESAAKWRMVRAGILVLMLAVPTLSILTHVSSFCVCIFPSNPQGTFEIDDQVEGLEYLMKEQIINIDSQRICVHGWSYGGYLSLQALIQRPDIFRVWSWRKRKDWRWERSRLGCGLNRAALHVNLD
jgi:dienelactone hydrolase